MTDPCVCHILPSIYHQYIPYDWIRHGYCYHPQEGLRESNNLRFEELRETNAELSALQAHVERCALHGGKPTKTMGKRLGNDVEST